MKFFSELTNKFYDTHEACITAEAEYTAAEEAKAAEEKRKIEEKEARKAAVDKAFTTMEEAKVRFYELLNDYCTDYGSYENTRAVCNNANSYKILNDFINELFN